MGTQNLDLLLGKLCKSVEINGKRSIIFRMADGNDVIMYHEQDCCETVLIEDIDGDLADILTGQTIIVAEESSKSWLDREGDCMDESCTWTFYRFATAKGWVTIRWYGSSNGYYSESVWVRLLKDSCYESDED